MQSLFHPSNAENKDQKFPIVVLNCTNTIKIRIYLYWIHHKNTDLLALNFTLLKTILKQTQVIYLEANFGK